MHKRRHLLYSCLHNKMDTQFHCCLICRHENSCVLALFKVYYIRSVIYVQSNFLIYQLTFLSRFREPQSIVSIFGRSNFFDDVSVFAWRYERILINYIFWLKYFNVGFFRHLVVSEMLTTLPTKLSAEERDILNGRIYTNRNQFRVH